MKTLLVLALLAVGVIGHAMPAKVILIRHGEEPKGEEGRELSERGWERAYALPQLFANDDIRFVIAIKPQKKNGSIRSIQTVQPIANALKLQIEANYDRDQVKELVADIKTRREFNDRVVLIAWQQESLSGIAHGLGAKKAPLQWGRKTFDRYWVLEFEKGKLSSFENLPQRLLPKDSEN
jgi:hypothetical protein